jgi:CheY-like chemotaxis protein
MERGPGVLLWSLRGHGRDVRCMRKRTSAGLELRVMWGDELFLTETFQDPSRLQKRAEEFKVTLEGRGWEAMDDGSEGGSDPAAWAGGSGAESVEESRAAAPTARRTRRSDRTTVLIVDDEPTIRTFLRRYLEEAGYAVTEAADVDSALNALDVGPVDAAVLDVRLPDPMGWGRTGLEVLAFIRLHGAFSQLPVLVLTGHPLEPEEQDLVRRHRAHLFMKPDGYRTLLQRLDQLTTGGEHIQH